MRKIPQPRMKPVLAFTTGIKQKSLALLGGAFFSKDKRAVLAVALLLVPILPGGDKTESHEILIIPHIVQFLASYT